MKNRKELAKYLTDARKDAGLSQWEVAKKLGYSSSQIVSNWERAMQSPPLNNLKKLCDLYSLNAEEVADLFVEQYREELYSQVGIKN
jgi:transcriptional regulator with XRE-family HTH domain